METIIAAADFFAAKLSYETDPTDLAASRGVGAGPVVIDTRSSAGWAQGRIPGAIHIPGPELADRETRRPRSATLTRPSRCSSARMAWSTRSSSSL